MSLWGNKDAVYSTGNITGITDGELWSLVLVQHLPILLLSSQDKSLSWVHMVVVSLSLSILIPTNTR